MRTSKRPIRLHETNQKIVDYVSAHPDCTATEIRKGCNIPHAIGGCLQQLKLYYGLLESSGRAYRSVDITWRYVGDKPYLIRVAEKVEALYYKEQP